MSDQLTPQPSPRFLAWPPILEVLRTVIGTPSEPVYLVGGAVRDAFLQRPVHDLDFATGADGRKLAKLIADKLNGAFYPLDSQRDVGRAIIEYEGQKFVIDIARFRGGTLAEDLVGRDFTINALAVPVEGEMQSVIDAVGGLADLGQKRLRRCTSDSISDDPVRTLRAVRQSVAFNFMIEPQTRSDLRKYGERITNVSVERVRDEFMTMLGGTRPHVALRTLDALGILKLIVPEVDAMRGVEQTAPHVFDVLEHSFSTVEKMHGIITTISPARTDETAAEASYGMIVYLMDRFRKQLQARLDQPQPNDRSVSALMILAALLHDCGKPATRTYDKGKGKYHFYRHEVVGADIAEERGVALRLSNDEVKRLCEIVRWHMRPIQLTMSTHLDERDNTVKLSRRAIHRYWRDAGEVGIDVAMLTLADYLGMVGVNFILQDWIHHVLVSAALLDGYFNQKETLVTPPPLINGTELMNELSLKPGPIIKQILRAIIEGQAEGKVTTREQALKVARRIVANQEDRKKSTRYRKNGKR